MHHLCSSSVANAGKEAIPPPTQSKGGILMINKPPKSGLPPTGSVSQKETLYAGVSLGGNLTRSSGTKSLEGGAPDSLSGTISCLEASAPSCNHPPPAWQPSSAECRAQQEDGVPAISSTLLWRDSDPRPITTADAGFHHRSSPGNLRSLEKAGFSAEKLL